jgi:hypothetical protein
VRTVPVLLAALIVLGAAATAAKADTTITEVQRATPLAGYGDTLVWSSYDAASDSYRLTALVAGTMVVPPVAPRPAPFDADVGPGPGGRPLVVYSRCERERPASGCRLFSLSLPGGDERPLPAGGGGRPSDPAIWRDRLAWVRRPAGSGSPAVLTRSLSDDAPPRELPAVPERFCDREHGRRPVFCRPTSGAQVLGLDLRGRRLAVAVLYGAAGADATGHSELRLLTLGGRVRSIAHQNGGIGGVYLTAVAFAGKRVYFTRTCELEGCDRSGIFRYEVNSRRYAFAPRRNQRLRGYARAGGATFLALGGSTPFGCPSTEDFEGELPCPIVRARPLGFERHRALLPAGVRSR